MEVFINGSSCISAQNSFSGNLSGPAEYIASEMYCIDPDYSTLLDARNTRRMSKLMKRGLAVALKAIEQAGSPAIDGIISGTGLGCLDDTGNFLMKMADSSNRMMNPTAFIQSTHNTIGSQIALYIGNKGYNCTYSHLDVSFENALLDALMQLTNNEAQNLLCLGFDELTPPLAEILKRLNYSRQNAVSNFKLFNPPQTGTIAGEACAAFVLSNQKNEHSIAKISQIEVLYNATEPEKVRRIKELLKTSNSAIALFGKSGDSGYDARYQWFENLFNPQKCFGFKHLCGAFPTATAFALWLATGLLNNKNTEWLNIAGPEIDTIYIYNCNHLYHSIIEVSKC